MPLSECRALALLGKGLPVFDVLCGYRTRRVGFKGVLCRSCLFPQPVFHGPVTGKNGP